MSSKRNIRIAALAALVVACSHAVDRAAAVGHCPLQVAYVEGGTTPGVYWMRLCDDSLEFQPLGRKTVVRRLAAERLSPFHREIASAELAATMRDLAERYPRHTVPPDHAFYVVQYAGEEVHVPSDELPPRLQELFAALDPAFAKAFSAYRNYLVLR